MHKVVVSGALRYADMKHRLAFFGRRALVACRRTSYIVEIVVLDDARIGAMKRRYYVSGPRGRRARSKGQGTANVLAFPEGNAAGEGLPYRFLGEIYINGDLCLKHPQELLPLFVHGFSHLMGHTHDTPKNEKAMKRFEAFLAKSVAHRTDNRSS